MTYKNVIICLVWSFIVDLFIYQHYTLYLIVTAAVNGGDVASLIDNLSWASFEIPHSTDPIIDTLSALNSLWEYQLNLAIFTLSFFVNHAYSSWRSGKKREFMNYWYTYTNGIIWNHHSLFEHLLLCFYLPQFTSVHVPYKADSMTYVC